MEENALLEIQNLYTNFYTYAGVVKALDGISFTINKGETFGLVGETGCGKSVTANCILRLIPSPPGKIESGHIYFAIPPDKRQRITELDTKLTEMESRKVPKEDPEYAAAVSEWAKLVREWDLLAKDISYMQKIRGNHISMIFQEPMSALNPVFTAGDQIAEVMLIHEKRQLAFNVLKKIDERLADLKNYNPVKFERVEGSGQVKCSNCGQISPEGITQCPKCGGTSAGAPTGKAITKDAAGGSKHVKFKPVKGSGQVRCSNCQTVVSEEAMKCPQCGGSFANSPFRGLSGARLRFYRGFYVRMHKDPDDLVLKVTSKIPLLKRYNRLVRQESLDKAEEMLKLVRIPDPKNVINAYPFELSGGMQQRVTIAMALANRPRLLIADEPTTALDVTIQAQILKLMTDLQKETGTSILLITHNLGVVAETCHRVGVMYAGVIAEIGPVSEVFKEPLHPYTQGLMNSIPKLSTMTERLEIIEGNVPNLIKPPPGCRFNPRCPYAMEICKKQKPPVIEVKPGHKVTCHLYTEVS
jgi:peptide/nickel transport system ATP-binding protein